jgi:phosphomethylpyrimidine synthase
MRKRDVREMDPDRIFEVIEENGRDGVDFITVHCGVTVKALDVLKKHPRVCGIVSRGGTFLAEWMKAHGRENPLYARFDELLEIARSYDMTLSLGDGLRPGAVEDSLDEAQVEELFVLAALARRARSAGVQVMIEGPGHVPLNEIKTQMRLEKELTAETPFYVLGPIVTDIAPGYDHITSAIGGALAAAYGADFLCYVTPTEHLGLPDVASVREGVIAARIAAHAGDIAKGVKGARERDKEFSRLRRARDWKAQIKGSLDPEKAAKMRGLCIPHHDDVCSMCGDLCVFKVADEKEPKGDPS